MGKRVILAVALSFFVLLLWSALAPKPYPVANKEVAIKDITSVTPAAVEPALSKAKEKFLAAELPTFEYPAGNANLIFTEQNAAIKEVIFKTHQQYKFPLRYGLMVDDASLQFKRMSNLEVSNLEKEVSNLEVSNLENVLGYVQSDQYKKIAKDFTFTGKGYDFWLNINVQNISSENLTLTLPVILGVFDFSANNMESRYLGAAIKSRAKEKLTYPNGRKDFVQDGVEFVALHDRYFCALIEPESTGCSVSIRKLNSKESEVVLSCDKMILAPGQQIRQRYHIYLGPQDIRVLNNIKPAWSAVIHYGMFDFIAQLLLQLLAFFYSIVHSWGWAIIILSVAVYVILFPLTLKQMGSMKEMQVLQPRIEELRKTYKDNPQKLNKEIMELYKAHKVNPFGGCLPLVLQMPIFFALYQALMRSVALKGANFLWIKDLSEPDRLFLLPNSLPIIGNEINILPIIMAIGMFFQQKLSMVPTGSSSAEQQKIMVIVFPVMFGLIFYRMPSGLVLYWFVNSILMTAYQFYIKRSK